MDHFDECDGVGGDSVDFEWLQVHILGLVHREGPDVKVKFGAVEAMCGDFLLVMEGSCLRTVLTVLWVF